MRADRTFLAPLLWALLGAAALTACDSARPVGGSPPTAVCIACHGGVDNDTGAPPRALNGTNTARGVGAHTAHLGTDVQCGDCHKVPATAGDAGHRDDGDGRAEVTFGPRAKQDGSTPTYTPANFTCSGVYCHKTFQGGQGPAAPIWDSALNGGACQGCHGAPPANHAQTLALADCVTCHASTVTAAGAIKAGGTHLDGTINAPNGCTGCHGDANRGASDLNKAAPPIDTQGNQASAQVGAHQAHLVAGNLRVAMQCGECHAVPTSTAHSNGNTEVPFATAAGTIARNDGAAPAFNPTTGTCSGVYCHGATLHGGSNKTPVFSGGDAEVGIGGATVTDRCGVCHGFPPTSDVSFTHPQEASPGVPFAAPADCGACHPQTVDPQTGAIQLANHINGTVDGGGHPTGFRNPATHGPIALGGLDACRGCHGPTFANDMGGGLSCNACHANPSAFGLTGFGTHADWQTECTFCHGDSNRAEDASFPLVGTAGVNQIRANKAGPPVVTGKHLVGPGAHEAHYGSANQYSAPLICTNCHGSPLPTNIDHVVGSVVANWGQLAQTDGVVPSPAQFTTAWEGTPTCTNYCHGATLVGGTKTSPNWLEGATGTSCGSCHAVPLPYTAAGGFHVQNADCGKCHTGYTATTVNKATHVDGQKTVVTLSCTSCHGTAGRAGIAGSDPDVAAAPPGTTAGLATGVRVGAHQAHVNANTLRAGPLVCVDCHGTKPAGVPHANGFVEMNFGALADTGGTALPAVVDAAWEANPTCTNYCHGRTLAGGSVAAPTWTAGASQAACGACHGIPMPYTAAGGFHVQNTACGSCHTGYTSSSVAKASHINGATDVVGLGCTTCHTISAPFTATNGATASSDNRVGAHNKHLQQTITSAMACGECHPFPPSQAKHMDGAVNITWSARATAGGATVSPAAGTIPTAGAITCANYCHGATLGSGGSNRTPSWTATLTGCGSCHAAVPNTGEHDRHVNNQNLRCYECHFSVMTTTTNTVVSNPANHINGARNVQLRQGGTYNATNQSCAPACHGTESW